MLVVVKAGAAHLTIFFEKNLAAGFGGGRGSNQGEDQSELKTHNKNGRF